LAAVFCPKNSAILRKILFFPTQEGCSPSNSYACYGGVFMMVFDSEWCVTNVMVSRIGGYLRLIIIIIILRITSQ